jgi:hypothetical protein
MPPMTGRIIKEVASKGFLNQSFGLEVFYAFVIITCSLMIYFGTRELYQLSSHKGIKYFRQAFLFFALAYFSRVFIKFILNYIGVSQILDVSRRAIGGLAALITLPFFIYFSAMAVFCLVYSVAWKNLSKMNIGMGMFHILAIFLAVVSLIYRNPQTYLFLNIILFFLVLGVVYFARGKKDKKKHSLYFVYFLLLVFWILNILDILVPNFFKGFQLFNYLASAGVFFVISYKVLRRIGIN